MAEVHVIPEILRLPIIKTTSIPILFALIRTIDSLCVGTCYSTNYQNQLSLEKMGALSLMVELVTKNYSNELKSEAYYCMSMLCLNNPNNRKNLLKCFTLYGLNWEKMTKELISLLNLE